MRKSSADKYDEGISIPELIQKLKFLKTEILRRKAFVLTWMIVCAIIGFGAAFLSKPYYTARVTFALEEGDKFSPLSAYMGIASQLGIGSGTGNAYSEDNIVELLKTRKIIEDALLSPVEIGGKKDLLINFYVAIAGLRSDWNKDSRTRNVEFTTKDSDHQNLVKDSLLTVVYEKISKTMVIDKLSKQSNIMVMECQSPDQYLSRELSMKILKSLSNFYITKKTGKARETLGSIQFRADSVKRALDICELQLARNKDANTRIIRAEGFITETKLARDVEVLTMAYGEIIKNLEMAKFTLLNQTPLLSLIDVPVLPLNKQNKLPKRTGLLLGAILGFVLSICIVSIKYSYGLSLGEETSLSEKEIASY